MTQPDYSQLIDEEVWAYINRLDAAYPPDAVSYSVAEQRVLYDKMCAIFYNGRPEGVTVTDMPFGGVPCRRYEAGPSDVTVVYYHGGGFVVGSLDSHDDICAEICARTGYRVIAVDYGLAPEVVFPAHFEDAWDAFAAIAADHDGDLVVAGDSAGGNLAGTVAHYARGRVEQRIVGQVLIYSRLGGDKNKGSYVEHGNAPQLTLEDLKYYLRARTGGAARPKNDPRFDPLQDSDFSGLPPTVLVTAECDPVASDSETYRDALVAAGGKAVWFNEAGLVHACLRARHCSARAEVFFDRVVDGIDALGKGEWPYP